MEQKAARSPFRPSRAHERFRLGMGGGIEHTDDSNQGLAEVYLSAELAPWLKVAIAQDLSTPQDNQKFRPGALGANFTTFRAVKGLSTTDMGILFQPYVDEYVSFDLGGGVVYAKATRKSDVNFQDETRTSSSDDIHRFGYWLGAGMEYYFEVRPLWWIPKGIRLQMERQHINSISFDTLPAEPGYAPTVNTLRVRGFIFWTF